MPKQKTLNRKHNSEYKRVETYLDETTRNKLTILRKIKGFTISEYVDFLINKEFKTLNIKEGNDIWKNSTEKMHRSMLKED